MLRSIDKKSGESVESVPEKKPKATVQEEDRATDSLHMDFWAVTTAEVKESNALVLLESEELRRQHDNFAAVHARSTQMRPIATDVAWFVRLCVCWSRLVPGSGTVFPKMLSLPHVC